MRPASKTDRIAERTIVIPNGATPLWDDGTGSIVYGYERSGAFYGIGFTGTAGKPSFHYRFRSPERRAEYVEQFTAGIKQHAERMAARRAERTAWTNPLKAGDILYTSWGYDQTNVDFYVVTRVSGKRVWLRSAAATSSETGFMSGKTAAIRPAQPYGDEFMRLAQPCGADGVRVKIHESADAWPDHGGEHSNSWGH